MNISAVRHGSVHEHAVRSLAVMMAILVGQVEAATPPARLRAGVARVDISDRTGLVHDPCHARALVLESGTTRAVIIGVDAVAIGGIGRIDDAFLPLVRTRLQADLGIPPEAVLVNASHCHGVVRADTAELVIEAVRRAAAALVPVRAASGSIDEHGISENRRLTLVDGSEVDLRRGYSSPPDDRVAAVAPIDPQIGLLRLDRETGGTLAVVYLFACHPIMNPPWKGSSADFPGVASALVEETLGDGAIALFMQACGGDINPVGYKDVAVAPDAEPLGLRLGVDVLRGMRGLEPRPTDDLRVASSRLELPRADDLDHRIARIRAERERAVAGLVPTAIDFKDFLPLLLQHRIFPDHPSRHAHRYLHEDAIGGTTLTGHDRETARLIEAYLGNVRAMERITRLNVNLALLEKHRERAHAAGSPTIEVEMHALRIGDFKLVTFPGELTAEVGLAVKRAVGDPRAFVAGYTNGYIFYAPTSAQRGNTGYAQEDCDCALAPRWQALFEPRAVGLLRDLGAGEAGR
jgi:hypothetical protein